MFHIFKLIIELLATELPLQLQGFSQALNLPTLLLIWFWFGHACLTMKFCCLPALVLPLITFPPSRGGVRQECASSYAISVSKSGARRWNSDCLNASWCASDSFVPFPRNKVDQTWAETGFFFSINPWICGMVLEIPFCSEVDLIWEVWNTPFLTGSFFWKIFVLQPCYFPIDLKCWEMRRRPVVFQLRKQVFVLLTLLFTGFFSKKKKSLNISKFLRYQKEAWHL